MDSSTERQGVLGDRNHTAGGGTIGLGWPRRVALLPIIVAAMLVFAGPAESGTYTVSQCSAISPGPGQASWERSSDHYRNRVGCASGEGLQIYHDAETSEHGQFGAWVWRAPPGTVFTNLQANASLTHQEGHRAELVAVDTDGHETRFGGEHSDFRIHAVGGEFKQFHAWLRCVAPGPDDLCGPAAGDSAHAYVKGVFLRIDDRAAPQAALTGGSLLGGGVIRGSRTLDVVGADLGGGVQTLSASANGTELASDFTSCALSGGFGTALTPCPQATGISFSLDTTDPAFATGPNTIKGCVADLALDGSPNRACEQRGVWVDNVCPGSVVGGAARLAGRFARGGNAATVRSDRHAVIIGRVTSAAGGPIAGATVCALTRTTPGRAPVLVGATGETGGDGKYAIKLPPGPNRDVFVHHVLGDMVLARHGLRLESRVRPTFGVKPRRPVQNGDRLRFTGELPGPRCSGRIVKVQAEIGPKRWQVFRTDRTNARCRFRAGYKLRATRTASRYRFRAVMPSQSGYPYERGRSRVRSKRVIPG